MEFRGRGRVSLLEFLVDQFQKVKPELLNVLSELESVAKASESKYLTCTYHYTCTMHIYKYVEWNL